MRFRTVRTLIAVALAAAPIMATGDAGAQETLRTRNVVLVTIDGLRWQELFSGADPELIRDRRYTPDTAEALARFWRPQAIERRSTLMPFVWSTLASQGQLFGDRTAGSYVEITNRHRFSYPGYNEILTGFADPRINSNNKTPNPNRTVLEVINDHPSFKGKVAVFGSWDVFPFIVNEARSGIPVNAGYERATGRIGEREAFLNELQSQTPVLWSSVRLDAFTHQFALEYMRRERPRLIHIAYGEADDFAHDGRFDHYLDAVQRTDGFLRELWTFLQDQAAYRGTTTMLVVGDHGRGSGEQFSTAAQRVNQIPIAAA